MWMHVCCYCGINYSLAIFTFLWISILFPRILYFPCSGNLSPQQEHEHTMIQPHKSMPADFYRPITPRVIVVRAGRLSCQQCHWTGCAVVCGWDWMWMRKGRQGRGALSIVSSWQTAGQLSSRAANISSSPCSAAAAGHFQDLEKIRESDSICFLSLFPEESKGKTFPAIPPDWVPLT